MKKDPGQNKGAAARNGKAGADRADLIQAKLNDMYEGRRKYPRIVLDHPIYLVAASGESLHAVVHDISPDGLKIYCDRDTARVLHPSGKYIKPDEGPMVDARFSLQLAAGAFDVTVRCRIQYIEVVPGSNIAFGLVFKEFVGDGAKIIARYTEEALGPVEEKLDQFMQKPRSHGEISKHLKMAPAEVSEAINRMAIKGDIISTGPPTQPRHLKLSATLVTILERLAKIEKRLSRLERKLDEG